MRILIVGAGRANTSGISRYTEELSAAHLEAGHDVLVLAPRRLLPRRLHPAGSRTAGRASEAAPPQVPPLETLHYLPGPGTIRGWYTAWKHAPELTVLQWWTGTMLHHHVAISIITRVRGGTVLLEAHESIEPSEAEMPGVAAYIRAGMKMLGRLLSGIVVHSRADRQDIPEALGLQHLPVEVAHHGPYRQQGGRNLRSPDDRRMHILHLGVIRRYKGLPILVEAVRALADAGHPVHLTVAGEPWDAAETEGLASLGEHATSVLRHLTEQEISDLIASTDIVALPYLSSHASGPMAIAMAAGLPFAASRLETLVENAAGYTGAVWAEPGDPRQLAAAILEALQLPGREHIQPHSWARTVEVAVELAGRSRKVRGGKVAGGTAEDGQTAGGAR